ncbi:hypothetical protein NDAWWUGD_CDS0005 [Salmonella phage SeKF_80]
MFDIYGESAYRCTSAERTTHFPLFVCVCGDPPPIPPRVNSIMRISSISNTCG